jgi:hypothetical protein
VRVEDGDTEHIEYAVIDQKEAMMSEDGLQVEELMEMVGVR